MTSETSIEEHGVVDLQQSDVNRTTFDKQRLKIRSLTPFQMNFVATNSGKRTKPRMSIVNQSTEPSSWCSSKSESAGDPAQSTPSPSILDQDRSSLSSSYSSRMQSSSIPPDYSDDLLYNNPFLKKLRIPSVVQKMQSSYYLSNAMSTDSLDMNVETFFPQDSATDSPSESLKSRAQHEQSGPSDGRRRCRQFEHQFHWTQNIEHSSPWVRHRTKEIFDHVGGLLETRETAAPADRHAGEISVRSKTPNSGTDAVVARGGDRGETDDDDDGITYEIAAKLCDELTQKRDRDATVASENPCSCDDDFKWTRLYRKLVNCQQI